MKNVSVMIKPASSLCNLQCKYCFYSDVSGRREIPSYGIMQQDTMEKMLHVLESGLDPGDHITFGFQGGEPAMAGLEFYRKFTGITAGWDERLMVEYAFQTNGVLLDDEWCGFLKNNRFLVGISFDVLRGCHDAVRTDRSGKKTYQQVYDAIKRMERYEVEYNVLCTLTNEIAGKPGRVWENMLRMDLKFVQFTPCLDELDHPGESSYALTPDRFASFYHELFQYWLKDYKEGKYRSVKFFDDVVNYLAFGKPTCCGMGGHCYPQLVIEADGSAYPCDFYCLDKYCLGNISDTSVQQMMTSAAMKEFLQRPHKQPELCGTCGFSRFCGGGCKRMQREVCCSGTDSRCGYRLFLRANIKELEQIAEAERRWLCKNHA